MKMSNGPNKNNELKKFMKEIYTSPIIREKKNKGVFSPSKRKVRYFVKKKKKISLAKKKLSDSQFELMKVQNKYILKEAS